MATVLVAGATGQLGHYVTEELKRRGYRVRALVRDRARGERLGVDEVVVGDITDPATLQGVCDGAEYLFSCAGAVMSMNNFRERRSFDQVDYRGNLNLLAEARKAGVRKVGYVSLASAADLIHTEYAAAHERFVEALKGSGLEYVVIRPTGFFSFLGELLSLARKGPGMIFGPGASRTNPIHEADIARACVDGLEGNEREIVVGGPDIFTRREVGEMAFRALGKEPKLITMPPWLFMVMIAPLRILNRRMYDLMVFGVAVTQTDVVAPQYGTRHLREYFEEMAGQNSETV